MTDVTKIDAFVQSSPHPAWLATSRGECLYANPALEHLTGLKSDQINQVDWRSFVLEEDRAAAWASWQRSLASGTPYRTTVRLRGFDGVPATVELIGFGHTLNDGRELWLFTGLRVHGTTQQYPRLEAQLQATLNVIPAYTWYALPSGALTFANERTGDYLGLPKDHPLRFGIDTGAEWDAHIPFLHPDDREEARRVWSVCIGTGSASENSQRVRNAEGEYRWFLSQVEPLRASDGTLLYWIGVNVDIDERMQAEDQLVKSAQEMQRSEFYLTEAQRLGHIGNWVFDPAKGFEYWSDELFRIYDLDPDKGPPNSEQYLATVHPQDREFMASLMKRLLSDDSGFDVTKRIVRASGEVRYVRCVGTVDSDNNPSKRIGVGIDVTDHEILTQELRRRESALRAREHQLLGIIETIPSMLWSISPTGEITHVNQRVVEYFGAPLEELVHRGWERFVHPDDREENVKAFDRAIKTGESYSAMHRIRRTDGEYRWHHVMGEPLRDPHGKIIQWYGLSIDIDERKRAEDHLRDTRLKLAKASRLATVAELAGSIAHELNQPLMSVLANAQAAKRWLNAASPNMTEVNSSIERIIRDARGADETMQHIRALFKQESFDKKDVNIPNILREVVRVVQEDPKKRDVPIECRFEECLPVVHVDQIQIQQVFINLIVNAIEALEQQQVAPVVELKAETNSNGMLIQVIDNGPGVDDPDRIFDAFMTTKENGMGIGLAVSRSIIESHGGRLWAENNNAGGATFNVALPLSHASSATAQIQEYA
jgi:PAS domain S-box-containing protein